MHTREEKRWEAKRLFCFRTNDCGQENTGLRWHRDGQSSTLPPSAEQQHATSWPCRIRSRDLLITLPTPHICPKSWRFILKGNSYLTGSELDVFWHFFWSTVYHCKMVSNLETENGGKLFGKKLKSIKLKSLKWVLLSNSSIYTVHRHEGTGYRFGLRSPPTAHKHKCGPAVGQGYTHGRRPLFLFKGSNPLK